MKLLNIKNPRPSLMDFTIMEDGKGNWLSLLPDEIEIKYIPEADETIRVDNEEGLLEMLLLETIGMRNAQEAATNLFDRLIIKHECI